MYSPTTRLLTVLELLQAHPRLSGAELAARLETDRRTVRRYVMMLQDLGIPIAAERGRHGGYRLRPGFKLPPLMFSEDEALAVTLGLLAGRQMGLAAQAPAVEGALAKIERVLPVGVRERGQAVQETLTLDLPPAREPPASETLLTLSQAAQQGRRVRLRYRSWRGEQTERALDPYGLVHHAGRWYAVGWCHLRRDVRVFRLDRVLEAELSGEHFRRPPAFDSVDVVLRSLAEAPYTWSVEALLQTTPEQAHRRVPPGQAILEQTTDGVVLRARAERLDEMARALVLLGCPFIVREPPELRAELRRLAAEIAERAGEEEIPPPPERGPG